MAKTHIVTRFDKDLNEIETLLVEMADKVSEQIKQSAKALQNGDTDLAKIVSNGDSAINRLEEQIDEKAILLIALRQPMAEDLAVQSRRLKCQSVWNAWETMQKHFPTEPANWAIFLQ